MSHNIFKLRLIAGKIKSNSKYFLGRDTGMAGDLFPDSVLFPKNFHSFRSKKMIYWSDSIILESASIQSPTNGLIHFPKGTVYQVLATKGNWKYVLLRGEAVEEKSLVVNGKNLSKMTIFCWIQD